MLLGVTSKLITNEQNLLQLHGLKSAARQEREFAAHQHRGI